MNEASQHQFQVLTKRPERVVEMARSIQWSENIWIGTSVENNEYVQRAKTIAKVPAAIRFLSIEPLLGPVTRLPLSNIEWVIVGGESGPGARPMEVNWVRTIRDRCVRYEVPFFFKQWGGVQKSKTGRLLDGRTWDELPIEHGTALRGNKKAG
jgi:protein gp37